MKKRILVVDDEPDVRELVKRSLEAKGYDVEGAADGAEALSRLPGGRFDLVFLDVMMPGMDGFEVCRRIRQTDGLRELPVVFLTAKGGGEALGEGLDAGATLYITKPFNTQKLLTILRALLEGDPL